LSFLAVVVWDREKSARRGLYDRYYTFMDESVSGNFWVQKIGARSGCLGMGSMSDLSRSTDPETTGKSILDSPNVREVAMKKSQSHWQLYLSTTLLLRFAIVTDPA
jgi:hypothetical protein